MEKFDRYLKIVAWAQKRYTENNFLVASIGGKPSRYSQIETIAFNKILGA